MVKTSGKTMSIGTFHRKIALRMAGTGLILALVFGGLFEWYQSRIVMNHITERSTRAVAQFDDRLAQAVSSPAFKEPGGPQHLMDTAVESMDLHEDLGQLVSVDLYDTTFHIIASVIPPTISLSQELSDWKALASQTLGQTPSGFQNHFIDQGLLHILTARPLNDEHHMTRAYVVTLLRISPQVISTDQSTLMWTVLSVMGMILLNTLLLYPVIVTPTHAIGKLALSLLHSNMETLEVLGSAIAKRDNDSGAHNYRVTLYAVSLAETMGLEPRKIQGLIKGAFLHDVGKIGVQDSILMKPGRLDNNEYDVLKNQARSGLDMVSRSSWLDDANQVVAYHHERFDGSGYFAGLRGEEIPMVARIFTIANVFDALTSKRPYKEPLSLDQTMAILQQDKGTHFDPVLVDVFSEIAGDLYHEFSGRDDESLKNLLYVIRERYFRENTVIH